MRSFLIIGILLLSIFSVQGQGIEFFKGSWQDALEIAKKQDKILFVDAYAEWCGPCKRMARSVFPEKKVGDFFNKNFINVKLDMEKGEGLVFRKKYPVTAFPTLFFIDYTGELVQKAIGAKQAEGLLKLGREALTKIDRSVDFAKEYEKGNRNPELVYNYVKALNKVGKPTLKISNEYIRSQKDLNTPENLRFLLEAAIEADSRIFTLLEKHKQAIIALEGEQKFKAKVLSACQATVRKSIEYQSKGLLEEAKGKIKKHYPEKALQFALSSEMDYCLIARNAKHFVSNCKEYAKKIAKGNPSELSKLAQNIFNNFGEDKKAMKEAESIAKNAAMISENYTHHLTYAKILHFNGKRTEAMKVANKSLELAKTQGKGAVRTVEMMIQRMEG